MPPSVYYRRVAEIAALFLRLGATAFGGPAAHIALIEEECVRRRAWITHQRFLDVLGAANLIPGPTSTELAMHIGYARAGWAGLIVAGFCFIVPAALIVGVLAAAYVRGGALPAIEGVLRLVQPVAVVVIAVAVVTLARSLRWSVGLAIVATMATILALRGYHEVIVLLVAGVLSAVGRRLPTSAVMSFVPVGEVFTSFMKAGSLVLGSGYVLLPILRGDLVERAGWITEAQLLDAIAVGQVTPGPVFTTATFIGYVVAGPGGAVAATAGIFLPAFVFSAISVRVLDRIRDDSVARFFLDGVNVAAIALIALVVVGLARHAMVDAATVAAAIVGLLLVAVLRVNAAWVILGAALVGLLL